MSNNRFKLGKDKPAKTIEVYPYQFFFYFNEKNLRKDIVDGTYLRITARDNRQFSINIPGNSDTYGYLYAAAKNDNLDQLRDYARTIFAVSMLLTTDQTFVNDICLALLEWHKRKETLAGAEAEEITVEREQVDQTFMEDVARFADAKTDKERDAMRDEWKKETVNILTEDGQKTSDSTSDTD